MYNMNRNIKHTSSSRKMYLKIYHKLWYSENRERIRLEYYRKHPNFTPLTINEKKERKRLYDRTRRKTNPCVKLIELVRRRLLLALKSKAKSQPTLDLLGCTVEQLKKYMESKFQPGMTWENHGLFGWHIDHIRPCSSFNLLNPEEQKKCFHYTNLQPLWAKDNLRKSKHIEGGIL